MADRKDALVERVATLQAELRATEAALRELEVYAVDDLVECYHPTMHVWEPGRVVEDAGDRKYVVAVRRLMGSNWMRRIEEIRVPATVAEGGNK